MEPKYFCLSCENQENNSSNGHARRHGLVQSRRVFSSTPSLLHRKKRENNPHKNKKKQVKTYKYIKEKNNQNSDLRFSFASVTLVCKLLKNLQTRNNCIKIKEKHERHEQARVIKC
uniref:(northern house mosquito) hypothetical protein n=1 Tax=Culex pipiens TaxID=7175 RepID=A0A8D8BQ16_CULPI